MNKIKIKFSFILFTKNRIQCLFKLKYLILQISID